jgi:uncharacterized repeat protein (TIGR01451 family)
MNVNRTNFTMNTLMKKVAASLMMFALIISAFNMPLVSVANAQSNDSFSFGLPSFDFNLPSLDLGGITMTKTSCNITVDKSEIYTGGNVTLSWTTSGLDTVSINGQTMSSTNGTYQMTNVQANTTYTLTGSTADGAGHCTSTVRVACLPPPVDCRLEVTKVVDKSTAAVGDTLTYTITVKNVGTSDCTGSGVKIEDVLSDKLTYLTQTTSGNITAGYNGIGVYTSGDRTLHFNGDVLNPGESGTVTVAAKVNTPAACGDFDINNQAKATARELNNFGTWAYSPVVKTTVHNACVNDPAPSCDSFTATPAAIALGGTATLAWQTSNASRVVINNGVGEVAADGSTSVSPITNTTYVLTVFGTQNRTVNCSVPVTVTNDPAPSCDSFTATPATITVGGSTVLAWQTSNATVVTMNNGIGNVAADGSVTVTPTVNTTYQLTVTGTQNRSVNCSVPVTVTTHLVPVCDSFTATPATLPVGGGQTTLNWKVSNATNVTITPTIGTVAAQGSQATAVTANTNFVLTATDADGHQVTCAAPVVVPPPVNESLSCESNVTFTASDYSIVRGNDSVITWNTTGVDTVSISTLGATSLSGSKSVEPTADTTYVLTATKGAKSVNCPLTITVSSGGGGGGGSLTPRCELSISDNSIRSGEEVTLKWGSKYVTDIYLTDDHSKTLLSTDDFSSKDKKEHFTGSLNLRPTRDTEYTLTAKRGSSKRVCTVKVNVDDIKVITDRKPTVAGISLTNVPYTGFDAGPMLTIIFYILLIAWALFVTYLIVIRRQPVVGNTGKIIADFPNAGMSAMKYAETVRPDVFSTPVATPHPTVVMSAAPANLPTAPVVGYSNMPVVEVHNPVNPHHVTEEVVTALENRAHSQMALLSSDAIRHFISTTAGTLERNEALDAVIAEAKSKYPLEDGWIVINEARMQNLCETCLANAVASQAAPYVPALVPEGSSSLAEAIVTGNIVAAYEMIGNRPMFALADAAADFDNVVRARRGSDVKVSNLLATEAAKLSDEKIKNIVAALTGALDGTYTDEASAVKMAIMKAVKEVA